MALYRFKASGFAADGNLRTAIGYVNAPSRAVAAEHAQARIVAFAKEHGLADPAVYDLRRSTKKPRPFAEAA